MHNIAIIMGREFTSSDYYDEYSRTKVIDTITAWETVDDETFKLLSAAAYGGGFTILEQPNDPAKFIAITVADYVRKVKQLAEAEAKRKAADDARKAETARKRKEKALLRMAKTVDAERELLATLIAKHPDVVKAI